MKRMIRNASTFATAAVMALALAIPVHAYSNFGHGGHGRFMELHDADRIASCLRWGKPYFYCKMSESAQRAYDEKMRREEERRKAEERKRRERIETARRVQRAEEWSRYQDRQRASGGWVDPCRVGGC